MIGGTSHRLSSCFLGGEGEVEGCTGSEHRAGDVEEAVADLTEAAAVAVTTASQFGVLCAAARIALHGDAHPMVEGAGEAVLAGLSPDDDAALAGPLGDGRNSSQTTQGGVISSLQGFSGFCEQRSDDGPSHSRQGREDRPVMLLILPRPDLLG
jgi:hypothetical protein